MQIQIDGQGMEITAALRDMAIKKLERSLSHIDKVDKVHITLKVDKETIQSAHGTVSIPGKTVNARAESPDMYKTIDILVNNLHAQLIKHKEKNNERHRD